jgi:hypothetical protein
MAFPVVDSRALSQTTPANTSHVVTLPSGSGGIVIIAAGFNGEGGLPVITWPGSMTEFYTGTNVFIKHAGAYGTPGGSSITITTDLSIKAAFIAWRISGAENPATQPPEAGLATGTSTTPDPPSLSPTGGAKDYLWIAATAGVSGQDVTAAPASYTDFQDSTTGIAGDDVTTASGERSLNAASEDPGTFTAVDSERWVAATIAVHPSPAVAVELLGAMVTG